MDGHTPGPWLYRPSEDDDWGIVRTQPDVGRFLGGIICQARDPDAADPLTLAKHRESKTDPWEANARLIAAAPELLRVLELMNAEYGWSLASAAIAKARNP